LKTSRIGFVAVALLVSLGTVANGQQTQDQGQGGIVAVLDVAKVFKEHAQFNSSMEAIKKEIEEFEVEFRAKRESLQNQIRALQSLAGQPEFKTEEAALARKEADLQIEANQKRADILTKEAEIYFATYNEVVATVARLSGSYGITLVLRYDSGAIDQTDRASVIKGVNRSVVFQRDLDLTSLVLQELNKTAVGN
jgi:Skp family chaperone for outer membrane proteins